MFSIWILIFLASSSFRSNLDVTFLWRFLSFVLALTFFWVSVYLLRFGKGRLVITYKLGLVWFFRFNFFVLRIYFFRLVLILFFSFEIILSKVAVLTEAVWVMWLILMNASTCHLGFSFSVIAVMAHILCVVLLVQMIA